MGVKTEPHFMDTLTPHRREVLSLIAIGQDTGHNPRTLAALEHLGLICASKQELHGRPPVVVTRWSLPLPVHVAWAQWCEDHADEEDAA
jgi:predicted transcriptional regulator